MNFDPGQAQFSSAALRAPHVSISERSLPPREAVDHALTDLVCSSAEQLLGWRWRLILADEFAIDLNLISRFAERRINAPETVVHAVHRIALARRIGIVTVAGALAPWLEAAPEDDYSDPEPARTWPRAFFLRDLEAQDRAREEGRAYDGPILDVEPSNAGLAPDLSEFDRPRGPDPETVAILEAFDHAATAPVSASVEDIARELRKLLAAGGGKD